MVEVLRHRLPDGRPRAERGRARRHRARDQAPRRRRRRRGARARHGERQAPPRERRRVRRAVRRRRQRPRGRHRRGARAHARAARSRRARTPPRSTTASAAAAPGAAELAEAVVEACEQPSTVQRALPARRADRDEDRDDRDAHLRRRRRRLLAASRSASIDEFTELGPRQAPGLHGEDAPLALARVRVAQRARGLHAPGARHPPLHRRRLARAAVRRRSCRCRASARSPRRSTSTSMPTAARSACSDPAPGDARGGTRTHKLLRAAAFETAPFTDLGTRAGADRSRSPLW